MIFSTLARGIFPMDPALDLESAGDNSRSSGSRSFIPPEGFGGPRCVSPKSLSRPFIGVKKKGFFWAFWEKNKGVWWWPLGGKISGVDSAREMLEGLGMSRCWQLFSEEEKKKIKHPQKNHHHHMVAWKSLWHGMDPGANLAWNRPSPAWRSLWHRMDLVWSGKTFGTERTWESLWHGMEQNGPGRAFGMEWNQPGGAFGTEWNWPGLEELLAWNGPK